MASATADTRPAPRALGLGSQGGWVLLGWDVFWVSPTVSIPAAAFIPSLAGEGKQDTQEVMGVGAHKEGVTSVGPFGNYKGMRGIVQ